MTKKSTKCPVNQMVFSHGMNLQAGWCASGFEGASEPCHESRRWGVEMGLCRRVVHDLLSSDQRPPSFCRPDGQGPASSWTGRSPERVGGVLGHPIGFSWKKPRAFSAETPLGGAGERPASAAGLSMGRGSGYYCRLPSVAYVPDDRTVELERSLIRTHNRTGSRRSHGCLTASRRDRSCFVSFSLLMPKNTAALLDCRCLRDTSQGG